METSKQTETPPVVRYSPLSGTINHFIFFKKQGSTFYNQDYTTTTECDRAQKKGEFGTVYRVLATGDGRLKQHLAVKVANSSGLNHRIEREVLALRRLSCCPSFMDLLHSGTDTCFAKAKEGGDARALREVKGGFFNFVLSSSFTLGS